MLYVYLPANYHAQQNHIKQRRGMHSSNPNFGALVGKVVCQGSLTKFRRKQIIFLQGNRGHSIFYIEKGSVKLTVTSKLGRAIILDVLASGEFFGEDSVACQINLYSAIALTDIQTVRIDRHRVMDVLRTDPNSSYSFGLYLLRRTREIQQRLADTLLNPSELRLVRTLSWLAEKADDGNVPRVSQQSLGEMIGASRQRVNVLLTALKKSGVLGYDGGWIVHRAGAARSREQRAR